MLCGAAGSVDLLIAGRSVQALGAAMLVPASLALVLPEFPLEKRATATALWGATGAVAAATGPALGGLLVGWQSWRWVFFVNLLIGIPRSFRRAGSCGRAASRGRRCPTLSAPSCSP